MSKLSSKLSGVLSKLKKVDQTARLIEEDNAALNLLLKADSLRRNPEFKLKLATKFGIPLALGTGLVIGGSKFNRDSMPTKDSDYDYIY